MSENKDLNLKRESAFKGADKKLLDEIDKYNKKYMGHFIRRENVSYVLT